MARLNDPSDRFQIRSRGELLHPGSCSSCGSSDTERTYVDLGIFYDYEGTIYLCDVCGTHVGELLGLFTPEEVALTAKQLTDALSKLGELEKELEHVRPIYAAVSAINFSNLSDSVSDSVDPVSKEHEGSSEVTSETSEPAVSGEPEVEESVSKPGRSDSNGDESGHGSKRTRIFID